MDVPVFCLNHYFETCRQSTYHQLQLGFEPVSIPPEWITENTEAVTIVVDQGEQALGRWTPDGQAPSKDFGMPFDNDFDLTLSKREAAKFQAISCSEKPVDLHILVHEYRI